MIAYHIHIEGQVQGVGFRPYVWRMAREFGLNGWVSNGVDGVHIEICGNEKQCGRFCNMVVRHAPESARIQRHSMYEIQMEDWKDFQIRESDPEGITNLMVTPDLGLCDSCKKEILNAENRRFHYAFTTCTQCGPRYSIIRQLPYDRINTTMKEFNPCGGCLEEYNDPNDRRFYSQTNSCPDCAIALALTDSAGTVIAHSEKEVIQKTVTFLEEGKIVAMKGIGGYLLLCDAANADTIRLLRNRKHRPNKPFALLYPSLESVQQDAFISAAEADALLSIEAPIVLVKAKSEPTVDIENVAPQLDHIGVMLPYTPLMVLLMQQWNKPLIATSGNESGSPIFYDDNEALLNLQGIADYFITNNREIVVPQDDSVVRFTRDEQRIILRRSRGLAPTFLANPLTDENKTWLATGADMKSAFALLHQGNAYISQFLGDLENYYTQESYEHTFRHWQHLLGAVPQRVIIDKHPVYFSSIMGRKLSLELKIPITQVQHHEAHFSAVLAENNLLDSAEPVLGVIWDGTGWGDDGNIWGGEFFMYDDGNMKRVQHLEYFDHFLGDKVSREPRMCALSLCKNIPEAEDLLRPKFTETEWVLYNNILLKQDLLKTSSIGRLFDGVASLLGLCNRSTYEGEAALYLETLASQANETKEWMKNPIDSDQSFSLRMVLIRIINEINSGTPKEIIAYHFHRILVNWIAEVASQQQARQLAFSGGVFQNALLVHMIQERLGDFCQLYFHHQLSPNDECIGFGQLAWQYIQQYVIPVSRNDKSETANTFH